MRGGAGVYPDMKAWYTNNYIQYLYRVRKAIDLKLEENSTTSVEDLKKNVIATLGDVYLSDQPVISGIDKDGIIDKEIDYAKARQRGWLSVFSFGF